MNSTLPLAAIGLAVLFMTYKPKMDMNKLREMMDARFILEGVIDAREKALDPVFDFFTDTAPTISAPSVIPPTAHEEESGRQLIPDSIPAKIEKRVKLIADKKKVEEILTQEEIDTVMSQGLSVEQKEMVLEVMRADKKIENANKEAKNYNIGEVMGANPLEDGTDPRYLYRF